MERRSTGPRSRRPSEPHLDASIIWARLGRSARAQRRLLNADARSQAIRKPSPLRLGGSARFNASKLPPALWVGLACLVVMVIADLAIKHETGIRGDDPYYERMATHPGRAAHVPLRLPRRGPVDRARAAVHARDRRSRCWRCWRWPRPAAVLFTILRMFEIGTTLSAALMIGLVLSPPALVVLLRNGRNVDPESLLILTLGTLFILRRQRLALAITMFIGAAVARDRACSWCRSPTSCGRSGRLTARPCATPFTCRRRRCCCTCSCAPRSTPAARSGRGRSSALGFNVIKEGLQNGGWKVAAAAVGLHVRADLDRRAVRAVDAQVRPLRAWCWLPCA